MEPSEFGTESCTVVHLTSCFEPSSLLLSHFDLHRLQPRRLLCDSDTDQRWHLSEVVGSQYLIALLTTARCLSKKSGLFPQYAARTGVKRCAFTCPVLFICPILAFPESPFHLIPSPAHLSSPPTRASFFLTEVKQQTLLHRQGILKPSTYPNTSFHLLHTGKTSNFIPQHHNTRRSAITCLRADFTSG